MNEVIKQGHWDGQEIWREKTSGEILAEMLEKNLEDKKQNHEKHI